MKLLVDTNVLIDVLQDDPQWANWSIARLREQSQLRGLVINPVIYAELAPAFGRIEELDQVVGTLQLEFAQLSRPSLFLAAQAHLRYRRAGGTRHNILSDFLIGAHASVEGWPLLTRDPKRYAHYFPHLRLIAPQVQAL